MNGTHLRLLVFCAVLGFLPARSGLLATTADEGDPGSGIKIDARTQLVSPDPPVDDDAWGDIRLKEWEGRSAIHVHLRHLDKGAVYDIIISRGDDSELIGQVTIVSEDDEEGSPPRCFEAELTDTEASGRARVQLTGSDRTTMRAQVRVMGLSEAPTGAQILIGANTFDLDESLRGVFEITEDDIAALELGDASVSVGDLLSGPLVECANGNDDMKGNGKLKLDTNQENPLPFGVETLADLVGTTVNVANADGVVVLSGDIVDLEKHKKPRPDKPDKPPTGPPAAGGGALAPPAEEEIFLSDFFFEMGGRHDASFVRGDVNEDGRVNIADPLRALYILYAGAPMPYCRDSIDANDDGFIDASDVIFSLRYLFANGEALPLPAAQSPGFDSTGDSLFCREY